MSTVFQYNCWSSIQARFFSIKLLKSFLDVLHFGHSRWNLINRWRRKLSIWVQHGISRKKCLHIIQFYVLNCLLHLEGIMHTFWCLYAFEVCGEAYLSNANSKEQITCFIKKKKIFPVGHSNPQSCSAKLSGSLCFSQLHINRSKGSNKWMVRVSSIGYKW